MKTTMVIRYKKVKKSESIRSLYDAYEPILKCRTASFQFNKNTTDNGQHHTPVVFGFFTLDTS